MSFIYAILITYGLSLLIVHGSIFQSSKKLIKDIPLTGILSLLRDKFLELVNCMLCVGFWIGAAVGGYLEIFPLYNILFNGGLLTATTWIIHCIMSFLGNGYDAGRVFNITVTEPIKIEKADEKSKDLINNNEKVLQIFKG
jgi:hypothetical protein